MLLPESLDLLLKGFDLALEGVFDVIGDPSGEDGRGRGRSRVDDGPLQQSRVKLSQRRGHVVHLALFAVQLNKVNDDDYTCVEQRLL